MDPDIGLTEEEIEEQRRKIGDPRRIYTRSDEQYPDARFRPSYVDPSMEKPVYQGMKTGGAEESEISPIDFVSEVPTLAKGAAKGFPALMAMIKKKGPNLPEDMSLLDRIKLAAKRSGVKAPEMEAAQAEREALRNQPKDYFDKIREKSSKEIFEENEKKLAEEAAAREASRIDRAKEMGFDTETPYYHATDKSFNEFDPNFGKNAKASFFTPNPKFIDALSNSGYFSKEKQHIIPVYTRAKNIFDYENPKHLEMLDKAFENKYTYYGTPIIPSRQGARFGDWEIMERPDIQKAIKDLGFEGFNLKEGKTKNLGIFNPSHIRSKFAEFNPEMKDSADFMAGIAGAGLSFDQIKELLNKKSTDKDEL
jgi:hypothetical protein